MSLTSKQRAFLKSEAHTLKPIVQIGKNGLNDHIKTSVRNALDARELIKVTLLQNTMEDIHEVAAWFMITPSSKNFWNRLIACQAIVSRSPNWTITLIIPLYSSKESAFTTFHYPFCYKVFTLLLTSSHTQHGASVEKDPPAVLFSIHSPTLDRVWYHAPWLLGYMRRR